jgi:hypothetical protein
MAFSTDSAWTISSDIRLLTLGNVYSRVQALDRLQDGSNNSPWRNPASSSIFTFVSHKICDCILVLQDAEKAKSQNGKKLPSSNSRNLELKPSKPTTGPRNSNKAETPNPHRRAGCRVQAAMHRLLASGLHVPIRIASEDA